MTDMETLEQTIIDAVNSSNGIKSVDLAMQVMRLLMPLTYPTKDFLAALERLVEAKKIYELQYVVPSLDFRVKSIYFPVGTKIVLPDEMLKRAIGQAVEAITGFNPDDTTKET